MKSYVDVLENNLPRTTHNSIKINMLKFIDNGSPRVREFNFLASSSIIFNSDFLPISQGLDLPLIFPLSIPNNASLSITMPEYTHTEDSVLICGFKESAVDTSDIWSYFIVFRYKKTRTTETRQYFETFQNIPQGFLFMPAYSYAVQEDYFKREEESIKGQMLKGFVNVFQKQDNKKIAQNLIPVQSVFPLDRFFLFPVADAISEQMRIQFNAEFTALPEGETSEWSSWLVIGGLIFTPDRIIDATKAVQSWRFHNA